MEQRRSVRVELLHLRGDSVPSKELGTSLKSRERGDLCFQYSDRLLSSTPEFVPLVCTGLSSLFMAPYSYGITIVPMSLCIEILT